MVGDKPAGQLKRFNEPQRDVGAGFANIVIKSGLDIPARHIAQDEALAPHFALACRTRLLRPLK